MLQQLLLKPNLEWVDQQLNADVKLDQNDQLSGNNKIESIVLISWLNITSYVCCMQFIKIIHRHIVVKNTNLPNISG